MHEQRRQVHSLYTHVAAAVANIEATIEKLIPALSPKPIELWLVSCSHLLLISASL